MSSRMIPSALSIACVLAASATGAETVRRHDAHLHGHGRLDMVLDGDRLLADLTVPGSDLVGFEYAPRSDAELAALRDAVAALDDAVRILGLPAAARCDVDDIDIDSAMLPHDDEQHDEKHDEQHDDEHHGESAHEEEHDEQAEAAGESHAEVRVTYHLTCAAPAALDHLAVGYFAVFERAESLRLQAVGPWGQTAATLTPDAPRVSF